MADLKEDQENESYDEPEEFDAKNLIEFRVNTLPGKLIIYDGNGQGDVFEFYYESLLETDSVFCVNLFYKYKIGSVLNDNSEKFIKIFNNNENWFQKRIVRLKDENGKLLHRIRYCDILIEKTYEKHLGYSYHFHDDKKNWSKYFFHALYSKTNPNFLPPNTINIKVQDTTKLRKIQFGDTTKYSVYDILNIWVYEINKAKTQHGGRKLHKNKSRHLRKGRSSSRKTKRRRLFTS